MTHLCVPADLRSQFLEAMSHAACTVSVVTTDGVAGRAGVTVSAMSSVSADGEAPTLLVCVHHQSAAAAAVIANGAFCVNVLRDDQSHLSDIFGGRRKTADGDKFSGARWVRSAAGLPRVEACLVAFDCRLQHHLQVGTHMIFFGAVQAVAKAAPGAPLIYANRAYGTPAHFAPALAGATPDAARGLRIGAYASFAPYVLPALLDGMLRNGEAPPARHFEGDQRQLVEGLRSGSIDVALTYDLDLPEEIACEPLGSLTPYALLPAGHPLAAADSVHLADLAQQPFVLLDVAPSRDYFLSLFESQGLQPRIAWRSGSIEMVRGMVAHGLGCSVLATKPANNLSYDGLALECRPLADQGLPPSRIVLALLRSSAASAQIAQFVERCRSHFDRPSA
jgi:flavin reductase (DIM6/NTAB) family NADH-FMN oxidoreductase RutF/DNA-binding transcriptional LysR family regulator